MSPSLTSTTKVRTITAANYNGIFVAKPGAILEF